MSAARTVIAVAESDAYVKWAAWTLERAPSTWQAGLVLIDSPVSPTDEQLTVALSGSRFERRRPARMGVRGVRRLLRDHRPDVVLLACTGPTISALTVAAIPRRPRPVVVSGLPGIALPARRRAVRARARTDVFITHSRAERSAYREQFDARSDGVTVALSKLPFLDPRPRDAAERARLVFAAQASVPPLREQREAIVRALASLGPPPPVVKVRGAAGDPTTHHEQWPYCRLWEDLVRSGEVEEGAVEFASVPMGQALDEACCLATVSSTAALEAIAREVPVLVIDDFGVDEDLLNSVFRGSGLLGPLTRRGVDNAGAPSDRWREDNYFHPPGEDDWIPTVDALVGGTRPARMPRELRFWTGAARRAIRLAAVRRRAR